MNMLMFFILRESPPLKAVSDVMAEKDIVDTWKTIV